MSPIVQTRKLWVDQWNLTGHVQGLALEMSHEMQDDTVLGDSARSNTPGLEDFTVQHEGIWSAGTGLPDTIFAAKKNLADVLATIGCVDGADGDIAYFCRTAQGLYTPGAQIGELLRFSVRLHASGGVGAVRGTIMVNGTKSTTANGTARQLGAVAAGQKLYAGLHVLSASGSTPTLDVVVASDSQSDFAGTPEDQITFSQVTTSPGSQWATPVEGAITDDWWRVEWTLGGSSPEYEFVVAVGIQ